MVLNDISELFEIEPPAGICSYRAIDHDSNHGKVVDSKTIQLSINTSYGMRGCLYLLEPSIEDFTSMVELLGNGYGDLRLFIGADELLFTNYFQRKERGWRHIHKRFCCTSWHMIPSSAEPPTNSEHEFITEDRVFALHYPTEKPWSSKNKYPDFVRWTAIAQKILERLKQTLSKAAEIEDGASTRDLKRTIQILQKSIELQQESTVDL
eukprot:Filipodium_phascolosomae@DN1792_c0_g1_i1.p1